MEKKTLHYLPDVLIHHRVDVKSRKKDADYRMRLQRSLRAGWYLYFLFYPLKLIPKKLIYSIWIQLKLKVFKGDFKALKAILFAILNLLFSISKIIKYKNRLSLQEFNSYQNLEETKTYWKPGDK